jgi:rfaE bifunctional protein kinase chain/domain
MLTDARLEHMLTRIPTLTVGVLGDLFLDRYLDIDASFTEPSVETGLDAYQVVRVRSLPGAVGTIVNNLVALGAGRVCPISVIGDDGEGYELRRALKELRGVETRSLCQQADRRTPTYTKPMLRQAGQPPRELNRLDIKNRTPMDPAMEDWLLNALAEVWGKCNALIVLDQVSEAECGIVTTRVRNQLAEFGAANPEKLILADSRQRIGSFRTMALKPNQQECLEAIRGTRDETHGLGRAAWELAQRCGRPVFCTAGRSGILLVQPNDAPERSTWIPAYPVDGPIDIVGAGDSTSAGIACAVAAGASLEEAAAFGNMVASITIQQIGTTGTASPEQVRQRWRQVQGRPPS